MPRGAKAKNFTLVTEEQYRSAAIKRIPMPGDTFVTMPFRNLMRAPRRAALTIVGIAAAVSALVMILGAIDSFTDSIDRGADVAVSGDPDRVIVDLSTAYPADGAVVAGVMAVEGAERAEPALQVGGSLVNGDSEIDVFLRFIDFEDGIFMPAVSDGRPPNDDEVLLSTKAAAEVRDPGFNRTSGEAAAIMASTSSLPSFGYLILGSRPGIPTLSHSSPAICFAVFRAASPS